MARAQNHGMSCHTFAEFYCARHGLRSEDYAPAVFRHALYPHARPFAAIVRYYFPDYFAADLDLVQAVGRLRKARDFSGEADAFAHHPANCGGLRRMLRLRVSARRLRALVRATLTGTGNPPQPAADSDPPFA